MRCTFLVIFIVSVFGETNDSVGSCNQSNDLVYVSKNDVVSEKAAPVHPNEPQSFKLMPHRAVYQITLLKTNDPTVSKVTGECIIEIIKTKEGWAYKQNFNVQIYFYDGSVSVFEKNVASWESPTELSFHVENSRDGLQESILQGGAELDDKGGWRIYFQKPEMDGFITDCPIIFPIAYLEKILATIGAGRLVLSDQIVFDATHEMHDPIRVNTVITSIKDKKIYLKNNLLPSVKLWGLKEAIYDLQSSNAAPDYAENDVEIFSTGVINSMETTWGEGITVVLNLKELTIYK